MIAYYKSTHTIITFSVETRFWALVSVLLVFGLCGIYLGIRLCEKNSYVNKLLNILALVLGIFNNISAMIIMIIFFVKKDDIEREERIIKTKKEKKEKAVQNDSPLPMEKMDGQTKLELLAYYKDLLYSGEMTKEEFALKKKEILGY